MRPEDVPSIFLVQARKAAQGRTPESEAIRAAIAAVYPLIAAAERERCAKVAEPEGARPCDCRRCDCGNVGDAESTASWDERKHIASAIRALPDTGE